MSSGCGDVLSLEDLITAKKHQTFEAEVITGHTGGVASGQEIDYATNQVTGQVQKTLPAILRDMGFNPASFDFTTGGTVTERDAVVYNPADNNWYSWSGTLPHVVTPGTDPTADANWKPRTDQLLRQNLSSNDGFQLVGQAISVTDLRNISPSSAGQRILAAAYYQAWNATASVPFGGGEFIAVSSSLADDGGHVLAPTGASSLRWIRVTNTVHLFDYGIYLQTVAVARTTAAIDMADKVQAAIARAIYLGVPLVSPFFFDQNPSYFQNGIVLKKSIDATGLRETRGAFPWYCNNLLNLANYSEDLGLTTATGVSERYVIFCKNATFNSQGYKVYGSNFRGMDWDSWCIRNVGDRSSHLNGIMMICCHAKFTRLRGVNFAGVAVNMGSSYDYEIGEIGQELSGDANHYAIDAQTYPAADSYDEHNAYTIHGVLSHFGYDRGFRITGSKGFVGRIHSEGLNVTTTAPYAGYSFDFASDSGLTYINNVIGGVGSYLGSLSEDPGAANTDDCNTLIAAWGNSAGTIYTSRLSNVAFHAAGSAGCAVGTLRTTGDVRINASSRVVIDNLVMSGDLNNLDSNSSVRRANIAGDIVNMYGGIERFTVGGNAVLRTGGKMVEGTITGSLTSHQGTAGKSKIDNIKAASLGFTATGNNGALYATDCTFASVNSADSASLYADNIEVTTALNITSLSVNLNFTGAANFQAISIGAAATGLWSFGIGTKIFSGGLTGWKAPTAAPRQGTSTINPTTGQTLIYLGSTWKTLIAAPA